MDIDFFLWAGDVVHVKNVDEHEFWPTWQKAIGSGELRINDSKDPTLINLIIPFGAIKLVKLRR